MSEDKPAKNVWFLVSSFAPDPRPVEVEREGDKVLWLKKGGRVSKESSVEKYFQTWKEAREYVINRAAERVERSKENLQHSRAMLAKVLSLPETLEHTP